MNYKEKFADIYNNGIKREGAKELLAWIETTDFFTAPASTRYHCACECGLVMHSISVYEALIEKYFDSDDDKESFTVCALLHDLCKANFYKISMRNVKNENTGVWEKRPYYEVDDQFPYGHGEKSVFLIERFLRLKPNEAAAIRWHMGGFDEAVKGGSFAVGLAFNKYPLAVKLHLADLESTYLREKNTSSVNKTF
ncbi:MAG: hydrolase [Oscillospiraceae bacterium]|nr:hydrolase [Oscillospiraceae bacterium]